MNLAEQVDLIRQVFVYVDQFKDALFVIKIDADCILHSLFPMLVRDLSLLHRMGIRIVLVPGAHQRIDEVLTRYGVPWETVGGTRISTPQAIPFIKMAAFDVSNRIMTLLAENRLEAVIGNWVRARAIGVRDGVDYQETGIVDKLKTDTIRGVLEDGLIPIFPNIGWSSSGRPYNISSDELSAALARELRAEKLFFVATRGGVPADAYESPPEIEPSRGGFLSRLTVAQARDLVGRNLRGAEPDPILQLLRLACDVCDAGVRRVHIVDGRVDGVVLKEIFSSEGSGTMIYADEHADIRPIRRDDIPEILRIMQPLADSGVLLPRTEDDLELRLGDFVVYEVDGLIHASAALHEYSGSTAEIAALAVEEGRANHRVGRKLVEYLIQRARRRGLRRLFVLTTQTADWFSELGFDQGSVGDLPPERREAYDLKRRSRVLILDLTGGAAR